MKLKNALYAASAVAMTIAPVAAQAGTTASASVGKVASLSGVGERSSTTVKRKNKAEAGVIVLAVAGVAAAGYGVYELADGDDDDDVSPGA